MRNPFPMKGVIRAGFIFALAALSARSGETGERYGSGKNAVLDLYQDYISPARGSRCGMHPSCSQYAKLAFSDLNPADAFLATADRLLRCSQDADTYPVRYVSGIRSAYDPPPRSESSQPEDSLPIAIPAPTPPTPLIPRADTGIAGLAPWLEGLDLPDLAMMEYARIWSRADTEEERETGLRGMAACLRAKGDYRGLARLHRYVVAQESGMGVFKSSLYAQEAMLLFEADEYEKSLTTLNLSGIRSGDAGYAESQLIRCLDLARLERWRELSPAASGFADDPAYGPSARAFRALPDAIGALPARSPALAGWMSALLPGSGYAYAGRPGAALAAFVINGLFIWTVAEAVHRENYAIAATGAVLGSGWYFGGIRGSARSVRDRNFRIRRQQADPAVQTALAGWRKNDSLRRMP